MNMDKKKNLNSVAEATSNADISLKKMLSQFGKRPQQWSAHKVLSYIPTQECCGAGPNAALLVFLIRGTAVCFLQELCEAMTHAWLHAGTLKCCRTTITIRMAYVNKASFHQASSPTTVPTLPRSVWRRSALQPRRRAAGAEMRQKTHVKNARRPFYDSTADTLLRLHKMDKKRRVVARRATHAQVQRRTFSPLMSTRTVGTQWTRASPWPHRGIAALLF